MAALDRLELTFSTLEDWVLLLEWDSGTDLAAAGAAYVLAMPGLGEFPFTLSAGEGSAAQNVMSLIIPNAASAAFAIRTFGGQIIELRSGVRRALFDVAITHRRVT